MNLAIGRSPGSVTTVCTWPSCARTMASGDAACIGRMTDGPCTILRSGADPGPVGRAARATLPPSRRRPRGVAPGRRPERARDGASRADTTGVKVAREPCGRRPIARHEGAGADGDRDERPAADTEPAGGTTTRSSAGRAGRSVFQGPTTMTRAVEDLRPARRRGRDLRALARRRRLRARRRRLDRRPGPAAVHDHPAAAERHRLAPPRPRPADRGRGPDDPPRPDARPRDALPARARPRQHRRPVRARRDPRQGRGEPPVARPRALPRADARVLRLDEAGDARPAAPGRRLVRLGPAALHDGRGLGEGRPRRVRAAVPRRPRLPDRGPRQLVPRLPDERQRPRGHRHARDRARSGRSATTSSTRRPASPDPDATIIDRHDPARRRSSATRPSRSTPTTRATRALVGRRVRIPFVERDVPIIADEVVDPAFGTGAVKITPAHDHDDHATGLRHGLPSITILADDATIAGTGTAYDGLDRYEARRRIVADLEATGDLVGSAAARDGHRALPAQRRHRRAAAQDPVVHPDRAAGGPRPRRHAVRPDADPAGPVREDLGALADHHPRLEREPPAVVGPPHPRLVLPGRARDGLVARGRAGCLRGLRPPGARAHPGPGHLRHLVQLRPLAVLDPRLARRHARLPAVLPDVGDGDRLRHHLLLGRPDDDAGPPPHRSGAVPHGLPLGAHPRSRGPEDVQDEGQRRRSARASSTQPAPTRSGSRSSTARRPGRTSGSSPAKLDNARNFANKLWNAARFVVGARPASIPAGAERRLPDAGHLGPAERWLLSRAAATTAAVDEAIADYALRRDDPRPLRRDLERVLRLGPRAGQGPARGRDARAGRPRGDLVDARRGARHVPAPAPPGHAVRHRGAVGARSRTAPATPSC